MSEITVEEMLNECCRMRGIQTCLAHRVIHCFNWFYKNLIYNREAIINDELYPLTHKKLIKLITDWSYPNEHDDTLKSAVQLFYKYCKWIYDGIWEEK